MLNEIADCVRKGESFAFESTLSGLSYLKRIRQWRAHGCHVSILFLFLPDATAAVARIAERVRQGGHDIPEAVIRRRFRAGLRHSHGVYKSSVDACALLDNAGEIPVLLQLKKNK